MTLRNYLHRPKGLLIVLFGLLTAFAARGHGFESLTSLVVASAVAVALDVPLLRWRKGRWILPDGAFLTGIIVSMVLARHVPLYVIAITSAVSIASKHLLRIGSHQVFNPAAFGLLATFFIFKPAQDWWGSMPDGGPFSLMLLAATGVFIARKVHKLPLIVSFLGAYYLFFTIAAYLADPAIVMGVFRGADLHAVLYLTFFMVTDPPTSPPRPLQAIVFGVAAAAGCFIVREATHAVYFLPAGLLIANVLEAARRIRVDQRRRQSPAVLAPS